MLETLDDIAWSEIRGTYGSVPDLPNHIRALASAEGSVRESALYWLHENLIHQGTRWQATPLVVPFLLEVLAHDAAPEREQILSLMLTLAVESHVPAVPDGFNPDAAFADVRDVRIDPADVRAFWSVEDFGNLDDRLLELSKLIPMRDHYDTYLAFERGAPVFARMTADPNPTIRRASAWALGWLPRAARESIHSVRAAAARESDPYLLANTLLMLALLARYTGSRSDVSMFEPYLVSHQPRILRRAAALAIGTIQGAAISTEVLDVLVEGTEDEVNGKEDAELLCWSWNDPSLKGCCWRVIHAIGL